MHTTVSRRILAAAALAALAAAAYVGGWPPLRRDPTVLATVNLERVFNEMTRLKQAEADLDRQLRPYRDQGEALKQKIDALKQDLELLVAGTDKFEKAQDDLVQAAEDYSAQVEFINYKLDTARSEARRTLFQQIQEAATAFARDAGIDMIVADDSSMALQSGTDVQVVQQLALRRVVYSGPGLDVTDGLIAWINQH